MTYDEIKEAQRTLGDKYGGNTLRCSCCGEPKCDCGPFVERGSKMIDDPCRICGKCINHCPHQ